MPHQNAHQLLPPERHMHTRSGQRVCQRRGQTVVEQPSQRCIECDLAEARRCGQAKLRATLPKCLPASK